MALRREEPSHGVAHSTWNVTRQSRSRDRTGSPASEVRRIGEQQ